MTLERTGRKGMASLLRFLACSFVAVLLCSIQLPLHAADDAQSGYLSLATAHLAVWQLHNMKPGESPEDRDYLNSGTTFAIGRNLFVTNHHALRGLFGNADTDLEDLSLSQKGRPDLKIKRVLVSSHVYDLTLFETTKSVKGYLELATNEPSLEQLTQTSLIGYPNTSFQRMRQKRGVRVTYEDSLTYGIPTNVAELHGSSGGPILDSTGKVIAVAARATDNIVIGVKLRYLKSLISSIGPTQQRGFVSCASSNIRQCLTDTFYNLHEVGEQNSGLASTIAQHRLWHLYGKKGKGVAWLQKAAANDFPPSLRELALLLLYGRHGVDKDEDLATSLMRDSAQQNYAPAQFDLYEMLHYGVGTKSNANLAAYWLKQALEQGYIPAEETLN